MKADARTTTVKFKSVNLVLTFETQEEIDYFHAIFNHSHILGSTNNIINGETIRLALETYTSDPKAAHKHLRRSLKKHYGANEE